VDVTWIVERQVAAMSMPWPEDVEELPALGVRAVVSLTERLPEGLPDPRLLHLHVPVRDFTAPTLEQLAEATDFIDRVVADGGAVVVHCAGGLGRTGTVVAAWLVRRGWTAADALSEVRRRRPGSVETRAQEEAILRFARGLGSL
jgi:atypical dual specificity phosphatase